MDLFQKPAKTEVPGIRFGRDPSKVKFIGMMIHGYTAFRAGHSTDFYHGSIPGRRFDEGHGSSPIPLPNRHIFAPVP